MLTLHAMRRSSVAIFLAVLLAALAFGGDIQLTVTKKTPLKGELEDLVIFGLLKEMSCDSNGYIFSPTYRKYGSAINAIVRFPHDASSFTTFSIDSADGVDGGTVTDFELESNGELVVLARQVLKYSNLEVPIEFGKSFLIQYDRNGKILTRRALNLDTSNFSPTGVALLQGGDILVVGRRLEEDKTLLLADIYLSNGTLKTRFTLNPDGTKTSKERTAASGRVFAPAAIKANGQIYVLRGTTTEPVYVLSMTGQLLKTIQLNPVDIEFDSPKIIGSELLFRAHNPAPDPSGAVRTKPQRVDLPIFDLDTGKIVDRYFWYNESAGLACATTQSLTFIGQDTSSWPFQWVVLETKATGHSIKGNLAIAR